MSVILAAALVAQTALRLSETDLYEDFAAKRVAPHNRPYVPNYPLWSDGAAKQRWISLPPGTKIDTTKPDRWVFPTGTKLWKEFTLRDPATGAMKRVETRLIYKAPNGAGFRWRFYTYLWKADGSDAELDSTGVGKLDVFPTSDRSGHDVPNRTDCGNCHNNGGDPVVGFAALQLSTARDPLAPHAEPLPPGNVDLAVLNAEGLLDPPVRADLQIEAATPVERAALGYLHANCGNCHGPMSNASFTGLYFDVRLALGSLATRDLPVWTSAVDQPTTQYRVVPFRIKAGDPEQSATVTRMRHEARLFPRMPMLGAELVDQAAVDLLTRWVRELPAETKSSQ